MVLRIPINLLGHPRFVSSIQFALGECNPKPDNDFDCRLHNCFTDVEVPAEAVATGRVTMEAKASWLKLGLHIMKPGIFPFSSPEMSLNRIRLPRRNVASQHV